MALLLFSLLLLLSAILRALLLLRLLSLGGFKVGIWIMLLLSSPLLDVVVGAIGPLLQVSLLLLLLLPAPLLAMRRPPTTRSILTFFRMRHVLLL